MHNRNVPVLFLLAAGCCLPAPGCVTPQYAIRQTPVPDESDSAVEIERAVSQVQAKGFEQQQARPIRPGEQLGGFDVSGLVNRLSRVTERPGLGYVAYLYEDDEPNAAALADGRIYLSTGMLDYLRKRGSRTDELAFVIGHELAHTVAQHLVKRYRQLQKQQLLLVVVAAGTAAATRNASAAAQERGRMVLNAASLLNDVALSGYSQEQELEADQLGARYLIKAGLDPRAALAMLEDFAQFDTQASFLRTHPYAERRRDDLARFLADTGYGGLEPVRIMPAHPQARAPLPASEERLRRLQEAQRLYPKNSVSWSNLQRQIDALQ